MNQHFMSQDYRFQVPADAIVFGPQTEEIEQRKEHVAAVGLSRRAVVVAVLAVVLQDRFQDQ